MKLVLYYAPITCALVPYIALTEAGAGFSVEVMDFRSGEHMAPGFLRINPKHQVPVLVIDGEPLTENVAIQLWIARQFPAARLLPAGTWDEFKAVELLAWCDSGIHPHLTPNVLPARYCDTPGSEEGVRRAAHRMLQERFAVAEQRLGGRDWFFEHFTVADAFFFWCFRRAMQFEVDLSAFAQCRAHFERVSERDSVRQLVAFEKQALAQLAARHRP